MMVVIKAVHENEAFGESKLTPEMFFFMGQY